MIEKLYIGAPTKQVTIVSPTIYDRRLEMKMEN